VSIPTEDPRAQTGVTPSTNGTASHGTNGVGVTPASEAVPTTSSISDSATPDASVAPIPYEPVQPPSLPPPPDTTNALEPYGDAPEEEEEGMTMLEHLEELRNRMVVCSVALVAGLVVSALPAWGITDPPVSVTQAVMDLLAAPAKGNLQYLKPGEGFVTYFQIALMMGFVLALPVITWQAIAFVLPALLPHEKKYLYMAVPGGMLSFALGLMFGYVLVIPVAIDFLLKWNPIEITVMWQFSEYMSTVATLLIYMGLAFETPLMMFFLAKLRIIDPVRLAGYRKYVLILSFIIGAMITPTPDPLNQTLVSLPIYLLFELGLLLARLA
jgi:sec-independent protein translocase protein TatC